MLRWCSRNSAVTTAQMVWLPRSSGPVLQQPSRKNPVTGSVPQGSSSPPRTLRSVHPPSMPGQRARCSFRPPVLFATGTLMVRLLMNPEGAAGG